MRRSRIIAVIPMRRILGKLCITNACDMCMYMWRMWKGRVGDALLKVHENVNVIVS